MKKNIVCDERRLIQIPGNYDQTILFAVDKWIEYANESIKDHNFFSVALSGGTTPKAIFQKLVNQAHLIDWSKIYVFWSDERSVLPCHPESNYRMAMEESGLEKLPIPKNQIYRMVAESDIERNATNYEKIIQRVLGTHPFDLIMLGLGDDGHTASLFPNTQGLIAKDQLIVANYIPQKNTWRMTMTYKCINSARHTCMYVLGSKKIKIIEKILTSDYNYKNYPAQNIGTKLNPSLWILDKEASKKIYLY
ncbi:MAG: 6-phosphogluconolactonase [Chlamydiales bacterium]